VKNLVKRRPTKALQRQDKDEEIEIAGLRVSVWQPSREATVPVPLVIFSHGFHGTSTQSTFLMKALADNGYLVVRAESIRTPCVAAREISNVASGSRFWKGGRVD